jgi:putative glycosyl hydrolase-like family 15 (GHL15) protein
MLAAAVATASVAAGAATSKSGPSTDLAALRNCSHAAPLRPSTGHRYVILQAWEYGRMRAIKRRSPGTKVLVYKDMASTRDDARRPDVLPTGVGYRYADVHHPEWFLKDTSGRRVRWASWPHAWQMDVGSASYQRTWTRNVAAEVRRRGWDGVFVDGIARTMQYRWYLDGRVLAKYPGPDDYARATTSFLRRVGPALRRGHLLVLGNINDATLPLWRQWLGYLSGTSKEWWTKASRNRGEGMLTGDDWRYQMRLFQEAQARRKAFVAITYSTADDVSAMEYARASFLLFERSRRSAFAFSAGCVTEPAVRYWRADVGDPSGAPVAANGIWRRRFAAGLVVVNPSSSLTLTAALGGTYVKLDGSRVAAVALPPHTGLVLRKH